MGGWIELKNLFMKDYTTPSSVQATQTTQSKFILVNLISQVTSSFPLSKPLNRLCWEKTTNLFKPRGGKLIFKKHGFLKIFLDFKKYIGLISGIKIY